MNDLLGNPVIPGDYVAYVKGRHCRGMPAIATVVAVRGGSITCERPGHKWVRHEPKSTTNFKGDLIKCTVKFTLWNFIKVVPVGNAETP